MLKTNEDKLVMLSVAGQISAPACQPRICFDGVVRVTPGTGGITYNVKVGDCAFGLAGDHVEPGVSTKNPDEKANSGYNTLSCVGNTAYVVSGDAKGAKGTVTGKHGGIEHVLIHFDRETLDKLQVGDKIITIGGIYGKIDSIKEDSYIIKIESGELLRMARNAIASKQPDEAK